METFYIPTESDFRRWIKEAVKECLETALSKEISVKEGDELLISRKETARKLGISLVTLTDWVKRGMPSHKNRGRVYFIFSEVIEYIKRNQLRAA